ncbi:MAG: thiamine-binding protein [Patescibacteria group bacterium]
MIKDISFYPFPIGAPHLGRILEPVLLCIAKSGLAYHFGPTSTTVEGRENDVSRLVKKCERIILSRKHPYVLRLQTIEKTDSFPGIQKGGIRRRMEYLESIERKARVFRR